MTATRPRDAPTDLEREAAAVDFLLRHVGLDPERCRTEGGAINLGRVRSMLEDCAPQPETWSLYVADMIAAYLKWPPGDSRIAAVAGIIERRRKFDPAHAKAAPLPALTDEYVGAVVRSVQPHLSAGCKAWRELTEQCRYWLEAERGIEVTKRGEVA